MSSPRSTLAARASVLLAPLLAIPLAGSAAVAVAPPATGGTAASVAVSWQRIAVRTIYTEARLAPPAGALYLAFTSLAVHEAAVEAQRRGTHAATAAVATAAHHVLREYFPAAEDALDADLAASLARVPDGRKEDAGVRIGAAAAERMIASRVGDGRDEASRVYSRPPALGVWQPASGGAMALPWLGFVEPVVDIEPVHVDGPDPITSTAFARDYEEVRLIGAVDSVRDAEHTAIARFFSGNPVAMYRTAVCDLLTSEPLGLLPTTRLFARIDAAVANTFIRTWRLKYDYGYWRPFQAIATAATDGLDTTTPHPGLWEPLVANPSYPDYTTGHGSGTAPFAQVLRRTLGDDTPLVLRFGDLTRRYGSLSALEHDALNARIWGGLHFRDAMEDGYALGHTTANRVMRVVR
jgi:hypothetical protein